MSEQLIDIKTAENDLLACATFLAEKIGSSDGYAEAMKALVPFYLEKDNVDMAAELADSIDDPFVRDQLLAQVAEKCAEINDDEYAAQLVEAIEDQSFQGVAQEQIATQKAQQNQFDKAFKIADSLAHASYAYAEIAVRQEKKEALQTLEQVELPSAKVRVLESLAVKFEDSELLEKAIEVANEIELDEERIRAYLEVSFQFIELNRKDKAIEILDKARHSSEQLDSAQRDSFLSLIAQGFMKAGSLELADRTLDLVADKYEIAHSLVGYASVFWEKKEETEAIEALDEAYQILKSQSDKETRNSKAKFNLFGLIAVRFAEFGKLERSIEIANENPYDEIRNNSLTQIAVVCETKGNDDIAHQAIGDIDDDAEKNLAIISLSDVRRNKEQSEEALKLLNEAYFQIESVQQLSMKSLILNRLAERFNVLNDSEKSRSVCSENLQIIYGILDESHRVAALAGLANTFESLKFELNEADKEILRTLIRKSTW